jgi:hypothetical protein
MMTYETQVSNYTSGSYHADVHCPLGVRYVTAKTYRKLMEKVRAVAKEGWEKTYYGKGKGEKTCVEISHFGGAVKKYQRARWQGSDPMQGWHWYSPVKSWERVV